MYNKGIYPNPKKPSKHQLCKYAILMCLSEARKLDFKALHIHTGFENKTLIRILGKLIQWQEVKKENENEKHMEYSITKAGMNKLNYFKRKGYGKYWKPAWEKK